MTLPTILVVDDDDITSAVIAEVLKDWAQVVLVPDGAQAANGQEAVAAVQAAVEVGPHLDAVLMDIQMPELDGYDATRAIRRDPRCASLPIIAMTAHAFEAEKERCRQAGLNDHIPKPVDPVELFSVLARWISRASPRAQIGVTGDPPSALSAIPGMDFAGALRRLRGNQALLLRLLGELVRQWRDGAARIRDQLAHAEREAAVRTAHTLKGAAANLGVDELAAAAAAVEKSMTTVDSSATDAAIARLEVTLLTVCATLDSHLSDGSRPGV